jgi:BatD DUF11 like domain
MRRFHLFGGWVIATTMYLAGMPAAAAETPLVYATIEPAQIKLGDSARYTITDLGNGTQSISLPVVSGLDFQVVGRTRQFEFVNGTIISSTVTVVRVTAQIAGIFSIPGVTPKAPPLVLQVNVNTPTGNSSRSANATPIRPPILTGASVPEGVRLTPDGSAFIRLSLPKRDVYVGESVPVEIDVGMRSGFVSSLNGLPELRGDDFTLSNLAHQPERSEKIIDGKPFVLMTWHSAIAVVKPGVFSLIVEAPMTVRIRTRPRRDTQLDDEFGDPFLQNFFGTTVPKDISVASPVSQLTVLALPAESRPPDFHGAVGNFQISSDISPATADVGDPLTLRMRVTGSGNFDRVDSAMLEHVDQWKTYPPKSSFNPGDATGLKGEKTFEQALIASTPGAKTLPALTFSYFDPTTRRYEIARSAPVSVMISPSVADRSLLAPEAGTSAATVTNHPGGLRADHIVAGASMNSLLPLYLRPRFLAIPSLLGLALAVGWAGMRRREDSIGKSPARDRMTSKAANRALAQIGAAARSGDSSLFFDSARSVLQRTLAARWQMAPDQITAVEVEARLGRDGEDIGRLFALADESKYSGHDPKDSDFARWMEIVRQQLMIGKA